MKSKAFLFCVVSILSLMILTVGIQYFEGLHYPKYGVLIGANPADTLMLRGYDILVIDAEEFTAEEIDMLKMRNKKIYSYLNIGSIETFRKCYATFRNIALGPYVNWPNEEWVDVSNQNWQKYIVNFAAKELVSKGVDGLWIDNTDVYYFYEKPEILEGLIQIIHQLQKFRIGLIINGGHHFVEEAILTPRVPRCRIDGINQEFVFTSYDFQKMESVPATKWEKEYFLEYLNRASRSGLDIYLTEYEDVSIEKELSDYCRKRKWKYFLSPSINLDSEAK